jgi:hypothetical protein
VPSFNFEEFIKSPEYLDLKDGVYRRIIKEGQKIIDGIASGKFKEGIGMWGIGSGKSFLAEALSVWYVHYLLCFKNPSKNFGLTDDKPIAVVNMSTSATQAKNVIFAGVRRLIEKSPFFMQFQPDVLQTEIRFKIKNIALYCGNSQETMPLGYNVIFASLDEADWFLDNEFKSIAEDVYHTLKNRIASRFGLKGFIFTISAPRYEGGFISKLYQTLKDSADVYCTYFKTWKVKDREKMEPETFNFVVERDKDGKALKVWHDIPVDFLKASEENPEKFMRDFGARPSLALEAFDRDSTIIERNIAAREAPLNDDGSFKDWFWGDREDHFIHVDLAKNKDACGFAMGRLDGFDDKNQPKVFIDLLMQIKADQNEEIQFARIRDLIYSLAGRRFNIKKVSFDGWQSVDMIQILKTNGIDAETLSVDKNTQAYDTMKAMLHTQRFDCYFHPVLQKEYRMLELIKAKKVDHPPGGSKDVSDAVAGVCWHIGKNESRDSFDRFAKTAKKGFSKPSILNQDF